MTTTEPDPIAKTNTDHNTAENDVIIDTNTAPETLPLASSATSDDLDESESQAEENRGNTHLTLNINIDKQLDGEPNKSIESFVPLPNPHSPHDEKAPDANKKFLLPEAPPQHPDLVDHEKLDSSAIAEENKVADVEADRPATDNSIPDETSMGTGKQAPSDSGPKATPRPRKASASNPQSTARPRSLFLPGSLNINRTSLFSKSAHNKSNPSLNARSQTEKAPHSNTAMDASVRFFSAYAETWVGLSPLWLMAEAVTPGKKVGGRFMKGKGRLMDVLGDVRDSFNAVGDAGAENAAEGAKGNVLDKGKDVVVVVDRIFRAVNNNVKGREQVAKVVEVVKAAGESALIVVTSSLDKLQSTAAHATTSKSKLKLKSKSKPENPEANFISQLSSPELKRALRVHARDALLILDKSLKHPVVVTGIREFARTRGIGYSDALVRVASLALGKVVRGLEEGLEEAAEELDNELEMEEDHDGNDTENENFTPSGSVPTSMPGSAAGSRSRIDIHVNIPSPRLSAEIDGAKNKAGEDKLDEKTEEPDFELISATDLELSATPDETLEATEVEMIGRGVESPRVDETPDLNPELGPGAVDAGHGKASGKSGEGKLKGKGKGKAGKEGGKDPYEEMRNKTKCLIQ